MVTTPGCRSGAETRGVGVRVQAVVPTRALEFDLTLEPGETLAVIGPNGAGKSTLVGILSGLLRPESGTVTIGADTVVDLGRAGSRRPSRWVPPHRRDVGVLSQDPLLFPHLSALENVAFGPRSRGASARSARRAAEKMLERIGLEHLAGRRPSQLSGGQAQRIALARALAAQPRLLLLDEPLSALDVDAKPEMRQLLASSLTGLTTVLVTHDVLDAVLLADRVAVIDHGRVIEAGPSSEVLATPRSDFAAKIAGLNILDGIWRDGVLRTDDGTQLAVGRSPGLAEGDRCRAVFRPTAVAVHTHPPGGSPRNVLAVDVTGVEPQGDLVRVRAGTLSADLTPASVAALDLQLGASVQFVIKATEVTAYPV